MQCPGLTSVDFKVSALLALHYRPLTDATKPQANRTSIPTVFNTIKTRENPRAIPRPMTRPLAFSFNAVLQMREISVKFPT